MVSHHFSIKRMRRWMDINRACVGRLMWRWLCAQRLCGALQPVMMEDSLDASSSHRLCISRVLFVFVCTDYNKTSHLLNTRSANAIHLVMMMCLWRSQTCCIWDEHYCRCNLIEIIGIYWTWKWTSLADPCAVCEMPRLCLPGGIPFMCECANR